MTATPVAFIKAGTTYFNVSEIRQVVTRGDGTADMYYSGGSDRIRLNLGATEAAAITALNTLLTPTDVTSYLT
jgi:D-hexose-6-phosphate mutarotase